MTTAERKAYLVRMATCPPFLSFGITPEWRPGEGDVEGFCHDEVVRQYHDTRVYRDGGVRVERMFSAWEYARTNADRAPDLGDALHLGHVIEPSMNSEIGFRVQNVWIGGHVCASPFDVPRLMATLFSHVKQVRPAQGLEGGAPVGEYRANWGHYHEFIEDLATADDWYLAFEAVHPFGDGNGRTGKILHNWLLGTLDEPVLVEDYFGGGNP